MKRLATIALLLISTFAFSQSKSYQVLKDHFADEENVHSFNLSGFLCRTAVNMFMDDEEPVLKDLMNDIDHIRLMVIPREEFGNQNLSVNGFRSYLLKDSFDEVMTVRDKGDHVSIFHREEGNKKNRYFVLVEDESEVVAIEMKGYVDPEIFKNGDNRISLKK